MPFSSKIEDKVKGVTVYNHMILPTIFNDAEEDCRHLKSEVQVWDVSVQRQVEIVGKDAEKLLEILTPRNVKNMHEYAFWFRFSGAMHIKSTLQCPIEARSVILKR